MFGFCRISPETCAAQDAHRRDFLKKSLCPFSPGAKFDIIQYRALESGAEGDEAEMTIGLLGGSFNPIHEGHLALARAALASGEAERVVFLPTGNPPHKHEGLADKLDRLAMVELAIAGEERMAVSREEIDREGVIYTVDTLHHLHERFPGCRWLYLIGADTLGQLDTWRNIEEVVRLCAFLVMMRPGEAEGAVLREAERWRAKGADIRFLKTDGLDISSTQVRALAGAGEPLCGLTALPVEGYIRKHGLYGARQGDGNPMKREKMIYRLKKTLDEQRFAHTLGVEKTARSMAAMFGADVEKAGLAGLLHDCAKCLPLAQMVKAAKDVPLDPVMKESKALMHSVAGMCLAQSVYGVTDPEVLGAIRWHTTGRAGMTKLEKIIYLADVVEPTRKPYPGLEDLREACLTDLDEAMRTALRMSLAHVKEQGKTLHPDTMAALTYYEAEQ